MVVLGSSSDSVVKNLPADKCIIMVDSHCTAEINKTLQKFKNKWQRNDQKKESTCQYRRCEFNLWVRKIPWRSKGQPTPIFLPGKSHGQMRLVGCTPWGLKRVKHDLVTKQWQQHGSSIFNFLRELCIVFHSGWTIYIPTSIAQGFTGSIFLSYIATYKWRKIWYGRTILTECCATYTYAALIFFNN